MQHYLLPVFFRHDRFPSRSTFSATTQFDNHLTKFFAKFASKYCIRFKFERQRINFQNWIKRFKCTNPSTLHLSFLPRCWLNSAPVKNCLPENHITVVAGSNTSKEAYQKLIRLNFYTIQMIHEDIILKYQFYSYYDL